MRSPVSAPLIALLMSAAATVLIIHVSSRLVEDLRFGIGARDLIGKPSTSEPSFDSPDPSGAAYRAYLQLRRVAADHYVDAAKVDAVARLEPNLRFLKTLLGEDFAYGLIGGPALVEAAPGSGRTSTRTEAKGASEGQQRSLSVQFRGKRLLLPYESDTGGHRPTESIAGVLQWLFDSNESMGLLVFKELANRQLGDLDPHSSFLDPEEFEELKGGTRGQFGGVGVVINNFSGLPVVREIVANSPAQMAGIEPNDLLIRIGQERVRLDDIPQVLDRIRRETSQGPVPVWLFRPRSGRLKKTFVSREHIPTRSVVRKHIADHPEVLHLHVMGFASRTAQEIYDLYIDAVRVSQGELRAVILDLRGNPGGLLDQAIQVSDLFLDSGAIVSTRSRYDTQTDQATESQLVGLPLIVLVNSSSASASEIVAGALKDAGRALVIGERTFGKGSVQSLFELNGFGAIKLTIAHYFTPSGVSIQNTGIEPHVLVKLPQIKDQTVWVAGSSETEREEDLLHHLDNPSGRTALEHQSLFEGNQDNWVWGHTADDLSLMETLGDISFTYPNLENSDQATDQSRDAYVRVALRFLKFLEQSKQGIWDLAHSYRSVLPMVRLAENTWIAEEAKERGALDLATFFSGSRSRSGRLERPEFDVQFHGMEELAFRARGSSGSKSRGRPGVQLVGVKLAGAAEQPAVWFPVQPDVNVSSLQGNADLSGSLPEGSFSARVPRLFWTSVSELAARPQRAHIFLKAAPMEAAHFVQTVALPQGGGEASGALHGTKLTVLAGEQARRVGAGAFDIVAEFDSPVGVDEPCEILIVPFLSRAYQVEPTRITRSGAEGCSVARFRLESDASIGIKAEYGGLVALLVRDRAGFIVGRMPVLEIIDGQVKESLF